MYRFNQSRSFIIFLSFFFSLFLDTHTSFSRGSFDFFFPYELTSLQFETENCTCCSVVFFRCINTGMYVSFVILHAIAIWFAYEQWSLSLIVNWQKMKSFVSLHKTIDLVLVFRRMSANDLDMRRHFFCVTVAKSGQWNDQLDYCQFKSSENEMCASAHTLDHFAYVIFFQFHNFRSN